MKTPKHTPGPWKAHFDVPTAIIPGHIIKADHGAKGPIALLWVGGGTNGKPTQIANAKLIGAAPDLLNALKLALSRAECDLRMWPVKDLESVEHQSITTAAAKYRAAIAKAEWRAS